MIAVLDLGIGNLSSLGNGLKRAGGETVVVSNGSELAGLLSDDTIHGIILPGVGSFGNAMFQLRLRKLIPVIKTAIRSGIPILGICLGMQLLFSFSEEHGRHVGLGLLTGNILCFRGPDKVPHMGWNGLTEVADHPLLNGIKQADEVYFVHSYYAVLNEKSEILAATNYCGVLVPAVVGRGCILGAQFHPEKSGPVGQRILYNFVAMCERQTTQNVLSGGGQLDVT